MDELVPLDTVVSPTAILVEPARTLIAGEYPKHRLGEAEGAQYLLAFAKQR